MKNSYFLIIVLMLFPLFVYSQNEIAPVPVRDVRDFFSKGTWNVDMNNSVGYNTYNIKDAGSESEWLVDVEANHFFIDNFGAGLRFKQGGTREVNNITYRNSSVAGYLNLLYGNSINENIGILGKISTGFGSKVNFTETEMGEEKYSANTFSVKASVGTPIHLGGGAYFTPEVGYRYGSKTEENYSQNTSSGFVGANLEFFMGCEDFFCPSKNRLTGQNPNYQQGSWSLNSRLNTQFKIGGITQTYEYEGEDPVETQESLSKLNIGAGGYYYAANNLGVGASVYGSSRTEKEKEGDGKYVNSSLTFMPMVVYHAPVDGCLNNLFVDVGVGFGCFRYGYEYEGSSEPTKGSQVVFSGGLGYNVFFSDNIALTPYVAYTSKAEKIKDSDQKTNYSGISTGVLINLYGNQF